MRPPADTPIPLVLSAVKARGDSAPVCLTRTAVTAPAGSRSGGLFSSLLTRNRKSN